MNSRSDLPPPPQGNLPGADADVAALLQAALIRPVDEIRAARDIAVLAAAAKDTANVTAFVPRRERTMQRVAAAAAVVVVASGAGFGVAQFGDGSDGRIVNEPLAIEAPDTANDTPSTSTPAPPATQDDAAQDAGAPDTNTPSLSTPAPTPAPAPVPAPTPAPDAPVGDAGDAEAIDDFGRNDQTANDTADETCDAESTEPCDTDDAVDTDGTDPRELLRERRFGAS